MNPSPWTPINPLMRMLLVQENEACLLSKSRTCVAFLSQLCSLSKTLYRGERKLLFLVRRIFSGLVSRSSGCRLWEEEASLVLLHRLLFPGSISFDFSGLFRGFSGSVRSRPLVFLCSIDSRVSQVFLRLMSIDYPCSGFDLIRFGSMTWIWLKAVRSERFLFWFSYGLMKALRVWFLNLLVVVLVALEEISR